jgi:cyanate permease
VATVPPTLALCREHFGARAPVVFGWVFASHQVGAAIAAVGAGWARDMTGTYDGAFLAAAGLCVVAALLSLAIRPRRTESAWEDADRDAPEPVAPADR